MYVCIADWEALADREPSTLLSVEELPQISKLSVEEPEVEGPKRRGRGTFTYNKDVMYSESRFEDSGDNDMSRSGSEKTDESLKGKSHYFLMSPFSFSIVVSVLSVVSLLQNAAKYGTRHVLVLADFSPNWRTTDLERLFVDFKDSGFLIRWVNDTTALAVFKTPSTGTYI